MKTISIIDNATYLHGFIVPRAWYTHREDRITPILGPMDPIWAGGQTDAVIRGGGELVSFYAREPELCAAYAKRYPQAKLARSEQEILEDPKIQLVVSASIANERAPLGVRVMRHGKDFMADKPGITTLEQLAEVRKVQAETKRIYSICYSERLENRAALIAEIEKTTVSEPRSVWLERLDKEGVPSGPINNYAEALADPQTLARNMVVDLVHPGAGAIKALGVPVKLSDTPGAVDRAAPLLGQHTSAILTELGYGESEQHDLRDRGIIQ